MGLKVDAKLCMGNTADFHSAKSLVTAINSRCHRFAAWEIHHEFREANTCADQLAAESHISMPLFL